jgi:DNA repair exonuclease SbcCD ATPase subunit
MTDEQAMAARLQAAVSAWKQAIYNYDAHNATVGSLMARGNDVVEAAEAHVASLQREIAEAQRIRHTHGALVIPDELTLAEGVQSLKDAYASALKDLDSERERRVAAQEAITQGWQPAVESLQREQERLQAEWDENDRGHREMLLTSARLQAMWRERAEKAEADLAAAREALREMRDFSAAVLRVFAEHNEATFDTIIAEAHAAGVKDGFGKRADAALQSVPPQPPKEIK